MNPTSPATKFPALGKITTPFGAKTQQEAYHPGVDIANKKGTPIKTPVNGTVLQTIEGKPHGSNDFGNSVIIKDLNGLMHKYSHLAKVNVKPGQQVSASQPVATMGDSGATYSENGGDSSNLDYRIVNSYGQFLNPEPFINDL